MFRPAQTHLYLALIIAETKVFFSLSTCFYANLYTENFPTSHFSITMVPRKTSKSDNKNGVSFSNNAKATKLANQEVEAKKL
jgi:hypothetical protein